jgi:hypothetical protein
MCIELILEILTAIGTVGAAIGTVWAVTVALGANRIANKNSWQQIRVTKLEELYEAIQSLRNYYPIFEMLRYYINVQKKERSPGDWSWLPEYYTKRDSILPEADRKLIISYIARIEVLTNCYTAGDLQMGLLVFRELLAWFSDLVFDGNSMNDILINKMRFPKQQEFETQVANLLKEILAEIKQ